MIQDRTAGGDAKRTDTVILLLITALAAFLRFFRLDYQSLWYDEAYTASVTDPARVGLSYIWSSGPVAYMPPLHHTLVYLSRLVGTGEVSLRLPSVLAGILTVVLIYLTAKYCFNRRVAAIASLIATVSTFHVYYSQEARAYALLMLLSIASTYFLVRALREKRQVWWLLYMASSAMGLYTHLYMAFLVMAQNAYLLLAWEKRRISGRAWILSQIVPFLLFSPWLITYALFYMDILLGATGAHGRAIRDLQVPPFDVTILTQTVGMTFAAMFDITRVFPLDILSPAWQAGAMWLQEAVPRLAVPYLLFSAIALWRLRYHTATRDYGILIALLFLLPLLLMLLISFAIPILNPRHFSFAYPYFCIFLALGVDTLRKAWVKMFLLIGIIAVNAVGLANYYDNPLVQREPWREVASLLEQNARPTDVVFVCCSEAEIALDYYYSGSPLPTGLTVPFTGAPTEPWTYLQSIMARRPRTWLILWGDWGQASVYSDPLREHCQKVQHPDVNRIEVYLYESCAP
jgi:mannosyltransferase